MMAIGWQNIVVPMGIFIEFKHIICDDDSSAIETNQGEHLLQ
jgi:hypothetical protein